MSQANTAVPAHAQEEEACPIGEVLDHIAGKWSIGIIAAAAAGPIRFTELERAIAGISRRMLTLNLRKLERDGLLVRTVYRPCHPRSNTASPPSPASSASHSQPSLRGRNDTAAPSPQPAPPTTAGPATQRADWPPPAKRSSRVWSAARPRSASV